MSVHKERTQMPSQITKKDIKKQIRIEFQKDMLTLRTVKKFKGTHSCKYFHFGKSCFCAINMMTNPRM